MFAGKDRKGQNFYVKYNAQRSAMDDHVVEVAPPRDNLQEDAVQHEDDKRYGKINDRYTDEHTDKAEII